MTGEQLSAGLALGLGCWLVFLAIVTGCWWAAILVLPAIVLAWGVADGER